MATDQQPVVALSSEECWDLLKSVTLGRLVTILAGQIEIFPVNFVTQEQTILFRTAEGTKLFATVMNDQVVFEADDHTVLGGWSVVARGTARELVTKAELDEAEKAQLLTWTATVKQRFVRITVDELSGRRFVFGPEPEVHQTQ